MSAVNSAWLNWIDGGGADDQGCAIATDSSGNVYVAGYSNTTATTIRFGNNASYTKPGTSQYAAYVGKMDSEGNAQWLQWIDGVSNEQAYTVAADMNGNVYVSGYSSSTSNTPIRFGDNASYAKPFTNGSAAFIAKLDTTGVAQWLQWLDGGGTDTGYAIGVDTSGNVYIGGDSTTTGTSIRFGNTASFAKPATTGIAAFVGKLDSSGVEQWLRWIDGTGTETTWGLSTDSAGNVYLAGRSSSTATTIRFGNTSSFAKPATTGEAAFVGKFDSSGTAQWMQWIDGDGTERGETVTIDSQGNVYVIGQSSTGGTSIRFGTNATYTKPSTTGIAGFVAKLSSEGDTQWLQWIDGIGDDVVNSVGTDLVGNVYVAGGSSSSESTIRFGENASYPKPTTVGDATFVGKLDSSGVGQWLQWIDGANNDDPARSLSVDPFDNVYVVGTSDTTGTSIRFGNYSTYTKPSTTGNVAFFAKFTQPKYNNVLSSVVIAPVTQNTLTPLVGQSRIFGSGGGFASRLPSEFYPFTSHTFTTAGATGRSGPILSAVRSAYSGQDWAQNTTYLQMQKQGIQLWMVPATGTYRIEVFGASHNRNPSVTNGAGARMRGDFNLRIGDQLEILIGQQGVSYGSFGANRVTGSGGSYVVKYNPNIATLSDPDKVALILAVAGGGGGVSDDFVNDEDAKVLSLGTTSTSGQNSRTNLTDGGVNGANGSNSTYGGGGYLVNYATQGGLGGLYLVGTNQVGGFGGGGSINNAAADQSAGGGGYSGGGGNISYSGGGGSYNAGSSQSNSTGANIGTGYVVITRL
jgi:hypothetical protein